MCDSGMFRPSWYGVSAGAAGRTAASPPLGARRGIPADTTRVTGNNRVVSDMQTDAVIDALVADAQLKAFVRDRRIEALPAKMSRRRELLDVVAQAFEPGVRYPEPAVDEFLRRLYPDHAALRRYLVDEELLDRANGEYWRIGGTTRSS
jgi:hypothetical protein